MAVAVEGVDMALVPFGDPGLTSKRYLAAAASDAGTSSRRPNGGRGRRIGSVWSMGAQDWRILRAVTRARGEESRCCRPSRLEGADGGRLQAAARECMG